ncbi:MAG: putative PEP-binding protein, partial [Sporomusa sp.]
MFPMIAIKDELTEAKQYLYQARDAVIQDGYQVGEIQVGMMIEVPAAALTANLLAKDVDFFSIGTNDLTQYTLAVDRENSVLANLGQHCHPAVLGLIAQVAAAAKDNGIWVGICGEAAGDTLLTPFFAALGIDELSMAPGQLPKIRQKLNKLNWDEQVKETIVNTTLACLTAAEVKTVLSRY